MLVNVHKWGNSLALRIPQPFAQEINITEGTRVNLTLHDGKLSIEPIPEEQCYELKDLLMHVNENNLHSEHDTGKPRGKEIW